MKHFRLFAIIFAFLMVYAVLPTPARAATPTDAQTQAVLSLLTSFGVDQGIVANVDAALHGGAVASAPASTDVLTAAVGASDVVPALPGTSIDIVKTISLMGDGLLVVADGYLSIFSTNTAEMSAALGNIFMPFRGGDRHEKTNASSTTERHSVPVGMPGKVLPISRDNDRVGTSTKEKENKARLSDDHKDTSECALLMRTLKQGSEGHDVAILQGFLKRVGDFDDATTTGKFGSTTERALQRWQYRMGIVASGTPSTTGFGALGPKTREMLMRKCKEDAGFINHGNNASSTNATSTALAPTCVLKVAGREREGVTLVWDSRNATYASSAILGERGPVHGAIRVNPTEATIYVKKVYGPGGEGQCETLVTVGDDASPAAEKKVVVVPFTTDLKQIVTLMGSGMAAVADGYLSLFGMSL